MNARGDGPTEKRRVPAQAARSKTEQARRLAEDARLEKLKAVEDMRRTFRQIRDAHTPDEH